MYKYLIVIEKIDDGFSAYAPDVPGVATVGDTVIDTLENMQEALELYFEVALERGQPLPLVSATQAGYIEVDETKFASKTTA